MGIFVTLILFAAALILSQILRPDPNVENARPKGLGDFQFPTATEGRYVPIIWGRVKIAAPNVVWYGDLDQRPITETVGGSLFSSGEEVIKGYRYYLGVQFALCRGPIDAVKRIWVGEKEVFNGTASGETTISLDHPRLFGGPDFGQGGVSGDVAVYPGTNSQSVSSYLAQFQQEQGDTPAYNGTCHLVLEQTYLGTSTQIKKWAFDVARYPDALGYGKLSNSDDANPMEVLYEILTNDEWGLGIDPSDIDVSTLQSAAITLNNENNGFSMVLDNPQPISQIVEEIERQTDCIVFMDRATGKWTLNLIRGGYTLADKPEINESNMVQLKEYARGSWEDTSNHARIEYIDRDREYRDTFTMAQDMANTRIQDANVVDSQKFPGVKTKSLATQLAWRELKTLSFPLAKVAVIVNREFHSVNPGDVVAFSNADLGIDKMAFRVNRVDLGDLMDSQVEISMVQDVFGVATEVFADAPDSGWSAPADALVDIPEADRLYFEAPKGMVDRYPVNDGEPHRVYAAVLNQSDGAVRWIMNLEDEDDNAVGVFAEAGKLAADLGQWNLDNGTLDIDGDHSQPLQFTTHFSSGGVTDEQIGQGLAHLMCIGGTEFIACQSAYVSGGQIRLDTIRRGLLGTPVQAHPSGTRVWLVRGGMSHTVFADNAIPNLRPVPEGRDGRLSIGSVTDSTPNPANLDNRYYRPYPAQRLRFQGSAAWNLTTKDLSDPSNTLGDFDSGLRIQWTRADWRTDDEVVAVTDESHHKTNFPAEHNTRYNVELRSDPDGTNTYLLDTGYNSGEDHWEISRAAILSPLDGAVPSKLRSIIRTRHTVDSVDYDNWEDVVADVSVEDTELTNSFNLGQLDENEISNAWSAPEAGTYTFTLEDSLSGLVKARLNGGSFSTVISAGNQSGTLSGVSAGDTIEVQHEEAAGGQQTMLLIEAPSTPSGEYAAHAVVL